MRKLIVNEFISLDGVAQAPGGADEDTTGGFTHGGWHMPFMDDETTQEWVLRSIVEAGGFLLGRRTYEIFAAYWPNAPAQEQVVADPLNTKPKHVVSSTLDEPLQWHNSSLVQDELGEAVNALKQQDDGDVHVIGSTALVRSLLADGHVDELRLMIDPIVLGGGKRFFSENGHLMRFNLVDGRVTSKGAILATYAPAS